MKKLLSLLAVIVISSTLTAAAAETKVDAFFNKLNQKEQELNQKIDAHQKARAEQKRFEVFSLIIRLLFAFKKYSIGIFSL